MLLGGSSKLYRYEDFTNKTPSFNLISEINPDPTISVIPQNYKKVQGNSLQDLSIIRGYPTISWAVDNFNVWLAQNTQKINLSMENLFENTRLSQAQNLSNIAGTGFYLASNILTSKKPITGQSGINAIGDSFSNVANTAIDYGRTNINYEYQQKMQMAEIEAHKKIPDNLTFGSNNATLLGYGLFDENIFTTYSIKAQFAKRIDKFFDMYGYSTNELKIPNLNNRPNWNYVKLIGSNIIGNIPEMDIIAIKSLFDNGITLWHKANTFLDYSQNNR